MFEGIRGNLITCSEWADSTKQQRSVPGCKPVADFIGNEC